MVSSSLSILLVSSLALIMISSVTAVEYKERRLKMSKKSSRKYGKSSKKFQYAQMYHYPWYQPMYQPPQHHYQPQYQPQQPKYQPQYPPKNPPLQPKYQPQYPPKNPPPEKQHQQMYYYPQPKYESKGKGGQTWKGKGAKGKGVFGEEHPGTPHMKIRMMAKGGYGNFYPRIPGPGPGEENGYSIPFGIWPRFPQDISTESPAPVPTQTPVMQTLAPTSPPIVTTFGPTSSPTTSQPTTSPVAGPTTSQPTTSPVVSPTTSQPTTSPVASPTTSQPTTSPVAGATPVPTSTPTNAPPVTTSAPTSSPTSNPTAVPIVNTATPTNGPTIAPTFAPTFAPTLVPTGQICTSEDISVVGFSLVDSVNNLYLQDINDGDTLDFDALEELYGVDEFTIVCNTTGPTQSAIMTDPYNGENDEGNAPWTLAGDDGVNFGTTPFRDNEGAWTVTCQPFCGEDQSGDAGQVASIDFDVTFTAPPTGAPTLDCTTCREGCIFITDFVLVDASQNLQVFTPEGAAADYLVTLEEGETYSLSDLETEYGTTEFALLCVTDPLPFSTTPFAVGSVGLRDNNYRTHEDTLGNSGGLDYNGEGSAPYTLADDNSGDYNPTNFRLGEEWSITCEAFCESGLSGDSSVPVTRTFTMTE